MILNKDEAYTTILVAVTDMKTIKEVDEGTWQLDDNEFVMLTKNAEGKGKGGRYQTFGVGGDPPTSLRLIELNSSPPSNIIRRDEPCSLRTG